MQVLPPEYGVFFGSMLRSVFLSVRRIDQSSSARRVDDTSALKANIVNHLYCSASMAAEVLPWSNECHL